MDHHACECSFLYIWELFFVAQCCPPAMFFCELHAGNPQGMPGSGGSHPFRRISEGPQLVRHLSSHIKWGQHIHQDNTVPFLSTLMCTPWEQTPSACWRPITCSSLPHVINTSHPICHLEALNAVAAFQTWAPSADVSSNTCIWIALWQLLFVKQERAGTTASMHVPSNCG